MRLTFADLERWVREHKGLKAFNAHQSTGCGVDDGMLSDVALAEMVGVTRRTVQRWKHSGLHPEMAERAAESLGEHPALIWGGAWWDVVGTDGRIPAMSGGHFR